MASSNEENTVSRKNAIYFGYGSNLWKQQMRLRCPTSTYLGVARLPDYRWIINDRGYANVVQNTAADPDFLDRYCYGLVYELLQADEDKLDVNEGVPTAYIKEYLDTDFWHSTDDSPVDTTQAPKSKRMLVYIDRKRMTETAPKAEYIYRMNMGIADATAAGVPEDYIQKTLRRFIPSKHDEEAEALAQKQALNFIDED